jgi:glucan endo-1,3-beta-D-glucosidase
LLILSVEDFFSSNSSIVNMSASTFVTALLALIPSTLAAYKGFNYGTTFSDGSYKQDVDFENEFNSAKNLAGTNGFTSARLYTMIQGGTTSTPISAIQAAINTQTTLLLGMWASAGDTGFANELAALTTAINQYGTAFTDLIVGISVGSEDLYRLTPDWTDTSSEPGAEPNTIVSYISEVRSTITSTAASGKPVGHVDTWTAWVNASNDAVISACDFIGMDAYPYYQSSNANTIGNANALFFSAYNATVAASGGKQVWVTETGWPTGMLFPYILLIE